MRKIDPTGQFRRDYKREAKGQHRATLDADLEPVLEALASDQPLESRHRCQRKEKRQWRAGQSDKAVMTVEGRCRLVLGIYHHSVGSNLGTGRTVERIGQQSATKTLAFEGPVGAKLRFHDI